MQTKVLKELTQLCGSKLPREWLELLDDYPQELRTALRSDDGSIEEGTVSGVELLIRPDDVLALNREVRACSILDPEGREFRWPSHYFVIGESGEGDYYCLDVTSDDNEVVQFKHLGVEFEVIADSLEEFVEMLIESYLSEDDE